MCINNYRWPFEKYWLQKIYFGVYTTAQKNVTCLNVRDPKVVFFCFSEVGGEDDSLDGVWGSTTWGSFGSTIAWNNVRPLQQNFMPSFTLGHLFLHSLQEAGQHHWGTWGAMEGRQRRQAGRVWVRGATIVGHSGLGLTSYRLVSLPSLEMVCSTVDKDLEFREPCISQPFKAGFPFLEGELWRATWHQGLV